MNRVQPIVTSASEPAPTPGKWYSFKSICTGSASADCEPSELKAMARRVEVMS